MASAHRIFEHEVPRTMPSRQRTVNLPGVPLRISGGTGIASINRDSGRLFLFDNELRPAGEFPLTDLPAQNSRARHERLLILSDLTVILIGLDHTLCIDHSGRRRWSIAYPSWPRGIVGGDAVVVETHLAIAIPVKPAPTGYLQVPAAELAVVDIGDGSQRNRIELVDEIGDPEGFHGVTRRDRTGGMLDAGYGQDGAQIWRIASRAGHVEATPLGTDDRILADLSPNGDMIVTTPHGDGALVLYRWSDLTEVGRLERASVFVLEQGEHAYPADSFDFYAWFLSDDRLLAMTRQGRLLLVDRREMAVVCEVVLKGFNIFGYDGRGKPVEDLREAVDFAGEIADVTVLDQNRFLVHGKDGRYELCEL